MYILDYMKANRVLRLDSVDGDNTDGFAQCPKCGAPMSKAPDGKMMCKHCATARTSDSAEIRHDAIWAMSPTDMQEAEDFGYVKKFTKDSNGFLHGTAPVTNIGVFSYALPNGTIRRELRLPAEVFHPDSIASLKQVPLTNDHPREGVSPTTAKELSVGSIGDGVTNDAYKLYAPICVTDAETIAQIQDGKRALSCGYTCDLEDNAGNWNGIAYDVIQRNIRYNHVAVVDKGRAGDEAIMRLDSVQTITNQKQDSNMKKLTIDSVEVEVSEAVANHVAKLDSAIAQSKADSAKLEADRDSHKDRADSLQAKLDEMPKAIETAVKSRMDLALKAQDLGVEAKADQANSEIMAAVVLKAFPKADSAKLADSNYLAARFDAACEILADAKAAKQDSAEGSNSALGQINKDGCGKGEGAEAAKKRYQETMFGKSSDACKK